MNLLEHYIEKIYSKTDITEEYRKKVNNAITEKYYLVDMTYNSYGSVTRTKKMMSESEYNDMIEKGYFMA
jgi:transcriptional accessory protein Tex/SPT6